MRLRLAFFFIVLSGTSLANQSSFNEIENVPNLDSTSIQSTKYDGILSVVLYLPLLDDHGLSAPPGQAQMTVTPGQDYPNISGIYVRQHDTVNGTCNDAAHSSYSISGTTVTLYSGHTYTTRDASNYALSLVYSAFDLNKDIEFGLADANTGLIQTTVICIAPGGICNSVSDCGWFTTRTWTPPTS